MSDEAEDRLGFLVDDEGDAGTVETPTPDQPEPQPEPAPEPQPDTPAEPQSEPQPQQPQQGFVPIAAVLDERDRRKALEQELAQLRQQQPQDEYLPQPGDEDFPVYQQAVLQQQLLDTKLNMSEELVRSTLKDDALVDSARDWALQRMQQSPAFRQEVLSHRNPYGFAVQQYQREQALSALSDPSEVEAFRAWKAAQAGQTPTLTAAPVAPQQRTAPALPPRSLASAPSAGGVQTEVEEEPFDAVFAKKG